MMTGLQKDKTERITRINMTVENYKLARDEKTYVDIGYETYIGGWVHGFF